MKITKNPRSMEDTKNAEKIKKIGKCWLEKNLKNLENCPFFKKLKILTNINDKQIEKSKKLEESKNLGLYKREVMC